MSATEFPIPEANIQGCIKLLIEKEGLEQLSSSKIRAHLKTVFDHDFSTSKKVIDKLTQSVIESMRNAHHDSSSDEEQETSKTLVKGASAATPDVINKPSSSHESDDSDSDPGICSAAVPRKRAAKRISDSHSDTTSRKRAASMNAKAKSSKRRNISKPTALLDANGKKIDKYGPKTKLVYVSEQLQQVTGQQFMRNCDIVSAFWVYVKSNNLLDEKNKQFVLCNELLADITKKKRFKAFSFMKEITRHIQSKKKMEPEIAEQCDEELRKRIANYLMESKNALNADEASGAQKEEEDNSDSVENPETDKQEDDVSDSD